ncbi:MAG: Na(+)-translocating NADH-quinone reductase subunit F [Syntrophorhabdus sp. PtaU1.Bin058]|nr:MAG: Na(+)-translocating NADH-quinone reductase subunit F [Syntrophorhabdus sp. PtaU1.Bin058]
MTKQHLVSVLFQPSGRTVDAPAGTDLFSLMADLGLKHSNTCGGKGKCGKCKVKIEAGLHELAPPTETELKHLLPEEIGQGYRLACAVRIPPVPSLSVRPLSTGSSTQKLQAEGTPVSVPPDPAVKKYAIPLNRSGSFEEEGILSELKEGYGITCRMDYTALTMLPEAIERGKGCVTCTVYCGKTITAVEPGDTTGKCLGFAADIGTTKLAVYLVDLHSGEELAFSTSPNPQVLYGDDVMSRITFAMAGKGNLLVLQKILLKELARLVSDCCVKAGTSPRWIYEGCIVGNTCMIQLFLGMSPRNLAFFPYKNLSRKGVTVKAGELPVRLPVHRTARIYTLPLIAGFVGADTVAARLAVTLNDFREPQMLLDIGTNTEVVLSDRNGSISCSCASGPAFEGMHITHGMKADSSSIDRVSIDPETFEVTFHTIDGARPAGICGSGIASAIAEMLKTGIIGPTGRFRNDLPRSTERIKTVNGKAVEFVLAWRHETAVDTDISISQKDVVEVQKAKAAIYAGCTLLMKQKGITADHIESLVVAGAFGQYVDKESVQIIGMFPEVPPDRVHEVGNAAGTGARIALVSLPKREEVERIARTTKYYELAVDPDFTGIYAKAMLFPRSVSND